MVRYLSPEWLEHAARAVAAIDLRDFDDSLTIDYVVTGEPSVTYHVSFVAPYATLASGPAPRADVRFAMDFDTAAAVATGQRSAQRAVIDGDLVLSGDSTALLRQRSLLERLSDVLADLRAETKFD